MAVGNKYLERPFSLADSQVIIEEVRSEEHTSELQSLAYRMPSSA